MTKAETKSAAKFKLVTNCDQFQNGMEYAEKSESHHPR